MNLRGKWAGGHKQPRNIQRRLPFFAGSRLNICSYLGKYRESSLFSLRLPSCDRRDLLCPEVANSDGRFTIGSVSIDPMKQESGGLIVELRDPELLRGPAANFMVSDRAGAITNAERRCMWVRVSSVPCIASPSTPIPFEFGDIMSRRSYRHTP